MRARHQRVGLPLLLLALGALALGGTRASAGPPDDPIGDGRYGRVRLGWERHVPSWGLAPVTVFLENPDSVPHTFRVVVGSGTSQAEETVTLAANAHRRINLVLPPEQLRMSLSITEDGKLVASSDHDGALFPLPAVLLVDGDAGSRTIAEVVSGVAVFTCAPEDLSPELACITCFQAIVVRHANPSRAGESVRGVLEDYVRAGGTVVVCPDRDRLETRSLWEETDSSAAPIGSAAPGGAKPLLEKRRGLGRVLLALADPCAPTPDALALRTALGHELDLVPRRLFPRVFASETANEAAHRAGKLLAAFFGIYFLVAGPIFARRLRGAPPARVLRALVLLLAVFTGLAALMATVLRRQTSRVDAYTFVVIPAAGEPVASTEVIVASGGATRETVSLEGEDVSATAVQRATPGYPYDYRISNEPLWTPASARTQRGIGVHPVTFENLAVPTLGDARVVAISRARGYRPLDARIEVDPTTGLFVARVHNTSGRALGPIVVYDATRGVPELLCARIPRGLEAGASATATLTTRATTAAPHLVGFPSQVDPIGWEMLAPRERDGSDPRFVLLAEDEPPIRLTARSGVARQRAWRVEAIAAPTTSTVLSGFVGLRVKPEGSGVRVVTSSAATSQRALMAGWLPPVGMTLLAVGGAPVHSQKELDQAFARVPASGWVEITASDRRWSIRISTKPPNLPPSRPRPPVPVPVGDAGDDEEE